MKVNTNYHEAGGTKTALLTTTTTTDGDGQTKMGEKRNIKRSQSIPGSLLPLQ